MRYLIIFIFFFSITIFQKGTVLSETQRYRKDGVYLYECEIENGKVVSMIDCYYDSIIKNDNGENYLGEWKDGKYHGQGTLTYPNGKQKYVGEWKDNKYHGQGILIYPEGQKIIGEFDNGIYKVGNLRNLWDGIRFWFYKIK